MKKLLFVILATSILLCGCIEKEQPKDEPDSIVEDMQNESDSLNEETPKNNDVSVDDELDLTEDEPAYKGFLDDDSMTESEDQSVKSEVEITPDDTEQTVPKKETEEKVEEPENEPQQPSAEVVRVSDIKLSTYSVSLNVGDKKMPIVTMYPENATNKEETWSTSDSSVATVDYLGNIKAVSEGQCTVTVTSVDNPDVSATVKVSVTVAKETEATYIDGILIVNKTYPLPADYVGGWETEATPYLWEMIEGAKKDGVSLWMKSGYRSYNDQKYIYNNYVKRDGQAEADTYSARPGHSEHQTGLAFDLNSTENSFADTPEAAWIAENCYKYGFILRYPKGKEEITGYIYEPWHVRYVGVEKAKEIFDSGLCLEEFLNITSVYAD